MKTTLRASALGLLASTAFTAFGGAALAQDAPSVEANISFVSDYRFRGVSFTDENFAVQGGFDLGFDSGFYVGTWASNLSGGGGSNAELDLYGGYGFEAGGLSFDVGALGYFYPGQNEDLDYYELYGSVGTTLADTVDVALGVAYAPEQDNVGDEDNTYVYVAGEMPLGESPFSLSASLGYEDGGFGDPDGDGDSKIDWALGVSTSAFDLDWGLTYIDTSEDGEGLEETVVFSVGKAF